MKIQDSRKTNFGLRASRSKICYHFISTPWVRASNPEPFTVPGLGSRAPSLGPRAGPKLWAPSLRLRASGSEINCQIIQDSRKRSNVQHLFLPSRNCRRGRAQYPFLARAGEAPPIRDKSQSVPPAPPRDLEPQTSLVEIVRFMRQQERITLTCLTVLAGVSLNRISLFHLYRCIACLNSRFLSYNFIFIVLPLSSTTSSSSSSSASTTISTTGNSWRLYGRLPNATDVCLPREKINKRFCCWGCLLGLSCFGS